MQRVSISKKRQRTARHPSSAATSTADPTSPLTSSLPPPNSPLSLPLSPTLTPSGFNDASSADIILRIFIEDSSADSTTSSAADDVVIYVHSSALCRAKYFSALLSDRWTDCNNGDGDDVKKFNLGVSPGTISLHLIVIRLLYVDDLGGEICSIATAVAVLPVAVKLLFEECVKYCIRYLEAVPWSEKEEEEIMNLVPFLSEEESKELLARVSASKADSCEKMLHNLLTTAKQNHPNVAPVKAFVARLLREFSSKESARRVLEKAFSMSLKVVKGSLEEYSSPDFRGDHTETEAIQRLNLHTALTNGKHLLWLVERMIELRVADMAVKEWSEQDSFAADLQRAFRDEAWRNIVPGLPTVVLKCTSKLANAVVSGNILVARQVRMKLVKDWLPVLIVCRDQASPVLSSHKPILHSPTTLYLELEETFLRIISTLPMDDAQELLQQCLSFSTRDSEDCPHLITAFNTWFRRATRPPQHLSFS